MHKYICKFATTAAAAVVIIYSSCCCWHVHDFPFCAVSYFGKVISVRVRTLNGINDEMRKSQESGNTQKVLPEG
jgi:hypothetical protein